jgi:predicted O-methyltransferase YrrM
MSCIISQQEIPANGTHQFEFQAAWFNPRWKPKMDAIDEHDVVFMSALLDRFKPQQIVEVGCASGLSTSVMAMLM